MGRKGRKMLAPSTLNMLPKFELAPIFIYLVMLAKILRPSNTSSPNTARLFSSRMMSADSLTISIAVSTDIGDLQRRAVVDAVAKEAHHVAALVQCIDHPRLLRRRDLVDDAGPHGLQRRTSRRTSPRSRYLEAPGQPAGRPDDRSSW